MISRGYCVEFLTTLSGTLYTLLLRDELMEVEIRLAKGEYFQTHPSCVPESKGSLIEIQTFRLGIFHSQKIEMRELSGNSLMCFAASWAIWCLLGDLVPPGRFVPLGQWCLLGDLCLLGDFTTDFTSLSWSSFSTPRTGGVPSRNSVPR